MSHLILLRVITINENIIFTHLQMCLCFFFIQKHFKYMNLFSAFVNWTFKYILKSKISLVFFYCIFVLFCFMWEGGGYKR